MNHTGKRLTALFLALAMSLSLLCVTVWAEEPANVSEPPIAAQSYLTEGDCGENAYWKLEPDGTLTITGEGPMYDYNTTWNMVPSWFNDEVRLKKVIISEGITSIGDYAFHYEENLASVSIPDTVTAIGPVPFTGAISSPMSPFPTASPASVRRLFVAVII